MANSKQKEVFFKVYKKIHPDIKKEIILILNDKRQITWEDANQEIKCDTPLGEIILEKLFELELI